MKKKLILRAPILTQSGYGKHARFVLRALREYDHLFDIYLLAIPWGKTSWDLRKTPENTWIDGLLEKTIHYINSGGTFDLSVQVTIPGEFERIAPVNYGVTAGVESTKISPLWVQKCNENVDKIITTSKHASFGFLNTKYYMEDPQTKEKFTVQVDKPVEHVGFPVEEKLFAKVENPEKTFSFDTDFNFLTVAQWSPRKHLNDTIRWWVEEFFDKEVGLVVKTSIANGSIIDRNHTEERVANLLKEYEGRKCRVYLIHGDLNEEEMASLYQHEKVKCLISLGNEGFNLPAFEAASNDLPVLAVDWSGHVDFLYKQTEEESKQLFTPVKYTIGNVQKEAVWDTVIQEDSHWSYPKSGDYKIKLREVYNQIETKNEMARELGEWVRKEFSVENQYKKFIESLG